MCLRVQTCTRLTGSRTPTCTHSPSSRGALYLPTHLGGQVVACGQVLEAVQAVPVASSSAAGVVVDHLGGAGVRQEGVTQTLGRPAELWVSGTRNSTHTHFLPSRVMGEEGAGPRAGEGAGSRVRGKR